MHFSFLGLMSSILAFVALMLVSVLPSPAAAQSELAERQVPFVTLRNRTTGDDVGDVFGDERSGLKGGTCILRDTDLDVLTPLADAAPAYIREEFLRLAEVRIASPDDVIADLQGGSGRAGPVMYVHGFNIDFEKGCRRASLLQENTRTHGRFLWFSWPSDGVLTNYPRDESDLYWSVPHLADVILDLEARFGRKRVDILGHSLGARGVVLALSEVANKRPNARIGQVVLLAPDMDFEIFEQFLPRITPIAEGVTVYVTSEDRPLAISEQFHGYRRLGQAGNDVWKLNGVEVIDLSGTPTGSPTGHLYHIYSQEVGADLRQVLNEGKKAEERPELVKLGLNLWRLPPRE